MEKDRVPGGLAKGKSLHGIALHHFKSKNNQKKGKVSLEDVSDSLKRELRLGISVELEHTDYKSIAREIAMDHLYEDPEYYTKLKKIEKMKNPKKISVSELSEMIKGVLKETNVGGVNYDSDVAAELKGKVGDLSKLTPYALELGNDFPLNVTSDNTGKIKVYDGQKLIKIFGDVDAFLNGIKYGPVKLEEDESHVGHKDHEASMAKAELRELVKNAKSIYEKIQDGDELPGWVSSYVTLASDYMNSVNQYMEEKMNGDQPLSESEGSAKNMKLSDLASKYGIEKTDASGKFTFADFQPVLDGSEKDDKYALALNIANMILRRKVGLSWDDLPDVNSLWDCIDSADTVEELAQEVKQCCIERLEEEGGEGMF